MVDPNQNVDCSIEDTYERFYDERNNKMYAYNFLTNDWEEFSDNDIKDAFKWGLFKFKVDDSKINFIFICHLSINAGSFIH
jgi:hypothetical protein